MELTFTNFFKSIIECVCDVLLEPPFSFLFGVIVSLFVISIIYKLFHLFR